ncbi:hypothetical protein MYX75_01830 [Acidobacteria bacterium AH-259-A15]|nr:hypothetical protein [Acidobacteria bacterium AH-259-A15]
MLFLTARSKVRAESNPPAIQPQQNPERIEPEKLIFLLQYVGTDYGAAVESGQVVSEFEYQEMLDFSQVLVEQYRQFYPSQDLLSKLEQVRELIQEKRDWSEIRDLTQALTLRLKRVCPPSAHRCQRPFTFVNHPGHQREIQIGPS